MPGSYGPGAAGFGVLSVAVLLGLVGLLLSAWWLARTRPPVMLANPRESAALQWADERLGGRARALARRLSVDVVALLGLLAGLMVVAALGAGFAEVLDDVLEGDGIGGVDDPAARWLASHRDRWLTAALEIVTHLGDSAVIAAVGLAVSGAVAWRTRQWLPAVLGAVGIVGIGLIIWVAKAVVARSRPAESFRLIVEDGYSFPSGHATGTAAIVLLCAWLVTRWIVTGWAHRVAVWAAAVGVIGAVGFSRVYLGVHFVSDVLAGWLLGGAWATTVALVGSWWSSARGRAEDIQ